MPQKFINNLEFQFAAAVKASPTTGSPATELGYGILQLPDAVSAILPPLAAGDYYVMTAFRRVDSAESDYEIMRVTAVDTSMPGQTRITVLRAQEGTMPTAYAAGDFMGLRMTAGTAASLLQAASNLSDLLDKAAARVALGLGNVDNVRDADKPISTAAATALASKAPTEHAHSVAQLNDSTAVGRALVTATTAALARQAIGAGTSSFSGAYNDLSGRPSLGTAASLAAPTSGNASAGQVVLGDDDRLGNPRAPTAHQHPATQIEDATSTGRALLTAASVQAVRASLGLDGGRNLLHNPGFQINQLAVAGTVTLAAGQYGHDRWKAGSAGCTYSFASAGGVTTITIAAGSLVQVVDGSDLQTGSHVLSWGGTAPGRIGTGSYNSSGLAAAVTGGSNLSIEFGAGTLWLPQFERGAVVTLPEFRPVAIDTLLCKRFFQDLMGAAGGVMFAARGAPGGGNAIYCNLTLQTEMRAIPTPSIVGAFTTSNCGQPTVVAATRNTITLSANCLAAGDAYFFSTSSAVGVRLSANL